MQRGKALVNLALSGMSTLAEENFCLMQKVEDKKFFIKRENELTKVGKHGKEDLYSFSDKGKSCHGILITKNKSKSELENQISFLKMFTEKQEHIGGFVRTDQIRVDQAQASSSSTVAISRDEGDETNADIQIPSEHVEPTLTPGSSLDKSDRSRIKSVSRRLFPSSTSDVIGDQPGEGTSQIFLPPNTESRELTKATHRRTSNRKAHFCKFCDKKIVYLSRHLKTAHEAEAEVKRYVEATGSYKNRLFAKIKGDGDEKYNREHPLSPIVLKCNKVGSKRHSRIPCTSCNNLISSKNYFPHLKLCNESIFANRRVEKQHAKVRALSLPPTLNDYLKNIIMPKLREGNTRSLLLKDPYLIEHGNMLSDKYAGEDQHKMILSHIRTISKIIFKIKEKVYIKENVVLDSSRDCLTPKTYGYFVEAIREMGGAGQGPGGGYAKPSVVDQYGRTFRNFAKTVAYKLRLEEDASNIKQVKEWQDIF